MSATIRVWRLVKTRLAPTAFDGEGARAYGGRWTSPGTAVVYASETLALAALEILVHVSGTRAPESYSSISAEIPPELIEELDPALLPTGWKSYPAPVALQALGDQWAKSLRSAVLRVPSVIIPSSHNFVLNPAHEDFGSIVIATPESFEFDPRLLGD